MDEIGPLLAEGTAKGFRMSTENSLVGLHLQALAAGNHLNKKINKQRRLS
jgi:hypothetical protein